MPRAVKIVAKREVKSRISVSEMNLRKAASRLLASTLVSTEIQFIQRKLGTFASQDDLDSNVLQVRKMPWASIVAPD